MESQLTLEDIQLMGRRPARLSWESPPRREGKTCRPVLVMPPTESLWEPWD